MEQQFGVDAVKVYLGEELAMFQEKCEQELM
jgi:hypothetical protein